MKSEDKRVLTKDDIVKNGLIEYFMKIINEKYPRKTENSSVQQMNDWII